MPLVSCGNAQPTSESDGALHGELHIYRISYPDGHSEREFYLAPNEKTPADTRLIFRGDPELDPWTRIKVWGAVGEDGFKVSRFEPEPVDEDVASTSQAVLNPTKKTRTVGFVLMDTGAGVNLTAANAQTAAFGTRTATQAGLNQYYTENSYGGLSFSGEVLGPVTISTLGTCQQSAITQIENGWATQFGKTFQHWMTYIGANYTSCGWSGIGGEGTASRPASGSWYNASSGCTVLNQEVGHNLGMMHSGSLRCTGAIFADDPLTCTGSEYGDRHTVMGSGCAHLTAYDKWYEGFFSGCNGVRATVSGTYTLLPTEIACDGVQALQIPMPKTRPFKNTQGSTTNVNLNKYYLELRTKTGIDANETPSVLVLVGNEVPAATKYSEFTWVLDMNTSTTNAFDGMTNGQTFTDPAGGVSFTVKELDANHATIDVQIANGTGSPTCMDGTTFAPPGPASCGTSSSGGSSSGGASSSGGSSSGGSSTGGVSAGGSSAGGRIGAGGNAGASSGGRAAGGNAGANGAGGSSAGSSSGGNAGASSNGGASSGGANNAGSASGGANAQGGAAMGGASGGANAQGGAAMGGASPASGGANASGGSTTPQAGSGTGGLPPEQGGCSCSTVPSESHRSAWGVVGLLGLGLVMRRRRR
ncbi:MAG: MYXO-CTERM sorting domain-containing protein [Polyangiaceae bacterium]